MREAYQAALKSVLHVQITQYRDRMGLTQAQMAEILLMDVRSYIDLDHGKSMCGTLSFVLFLLYCCQDRDALLQSIQMAFDKVRGDVA